MAEPKVYGRDDAARDWRSFVSKQPGFAVIPEGEAVNYLIANRGKPEAMKGFRELRGKYEKGKQEDAPALPLVSEPQTIEVPELEPEEERLELLADVDRELRNRRAQVLETYRKLPTYLQVRYRGLLDGIDFNTISPDELGEIETRIGEPLIDVQGSMDKNVGYATDIFAKALGLLQPDTRALIKDAGIEYLNKGLVVRVTNPIPPNAYRALVLALSDAVSKGTNTPAELPAKDGPGGELPIPISGPLPSPPAAALVIIGKQAALVVQAAEPPANVVADLLRALDEGSVTVDEVFGMHAKVLRGKRTVKEGKDGVPEYVTFYEGRVPVVGRLWQKKGAALRVYPDGRVETGVYDYKTGAFTTPVEMVADVKKLARGIRTPAATAPVGGKAPAEVIIDFEPVPEEPAHPSSPPPATAAKPATPPSAPSAAPPTPPSTPQPEDSIPEVAARVLEGNLGPPLSPEEDPLKVVTGASVEELVAEETKKAAGGKPGP